MLVKFYHLSSNFGG